MREHIFKNRHIHSIMLYKLMLSILNTSTYFKAVKHQKGRMSIKGTYESLLGPKGNSVCRNKLINPKVYCKQRNRDDRLSRCCIRRGSSFVFTRVAIHCPCKGGQNQ